LTGANPRRAKNGAAVVVRRKSRSLAFATIRS
jgi:hypothetical protein